MTNMGTLGDKRGNCFKRYFGNKQAQCKLLRDTLVTGMHIVHTL